MASDKSPAFQFYPRDWDTDERVIPMTYEEEGVYFALCRRYWLAGSLPNDLDALRVLLKNRPSRRQMEKWWTVIGACFQVVDDRLTHKRLDRERAKQHANRDKRKKAADERWSREQPSKRIDQTDAHALQTVVQKPPGVDAMQCLASSSASASSTAAAVTPPPPPRRHDSALKPVPAWAVFRGERLYVPMTWHERHIGMLGGANAERRLLDWYQQEDKHLVRTQTPVKDWFKWLDSRYARWVPDAPEINITIDRDIAESKARRDSLTKESA